MNCFKLIFKPIETVNSDEETRDLLWDYLASLYKNGQILHDYLLFKRDTLYQAFVTLADDDALNEKSNNSYASNYLEKIKTQFEISSEFVGENLNTEKACGCSDRPEWYMLYTNYAEEESPVICGRCGKSVPLYKLPYIMNEDEFHTVLSWYITYRAVDQVWMQCLSDRFTYRQLNDANSQLSQQGRKICAEFEKATGIPFYYYLLHDNGVNGKKKTPDVCPVCGENWKLNGEKTFIDYKCDKCRLTADEV